MQPDSIKQLICDQLPCEHINISSGDLRHYEATVVSSAFDGKSRIQRHRMIYSCLNDHMAADIHALSMKLYTPAEFQRLQ